MRASLPVTTTRRSVIGVMARREARATLRGIGLYAASSLALIAAAWMLMVDVRALDTAGILVRADPFRAPLAIAVLVTALYLGASAAISTARDRESGTLEVLFYGPVDEISYLLGKAAGPLLAYLVAAALMLAAFALMSLITGFALTPVIIGGLLLSLIPAAGIISFGILLAVGLDKVRSAVMLFVGIAAALIGISIAYRMVLLVPIDDPSSAVLPLRDALAALDLVIRWISPFAYLERVVDAVVAGAWRTALFGAAVGLGYSAIMLVAAAAWLRWRGVYRRGE